MWKRNLENTWFFAHGYFSRWHFAFSLILNLSKERIQLRVHIASESGKKFIRQKWKCTGRDPSGQLQKMWVPCSDTGVRFHLVVPSWVLASSLTPSKLLLKAGPRASGHMHCSLHTPGRGHTCCLVFEVLCVLTYAISPILVKCFQ